MNVLQSTAKVLNLTLNDTMLAVTTISFDIAALELFVCILVGAKCVIASDFEKKDGSLLNTIFIKHHISIMQATPTHFKLLIQTGWNGSKYVRLLCGGEPLDSRTAQTLLERSKELWNMYGPTGNNYLVNDDKNIISRQDFHWKSYCQYCHLYLYERYAKSGL